MQGRRPCPSLETSKTLLWPRLQAQELPRTTLSPTLRPSDPHFLSLSASDSLPQPRTPVSAWYTCLWDPHLQSSDRRFGLGHPHPALSLGLGTKPWNLSLEPSDSLYSVLGSPPSA